MNEDESRSAPSEAALCARALHRLLPALIHRLNNALAVVQGVHDLGADALAADREQASCKLALLRQVLARLGTLARAPSARPQPLALETLLEGHVLVLGPLAECAGFALETHANGAHAEEVDGRFEMLLLALSAALLPERPAPATPGRRLRLAAQALPGEVRLTLIAAGPIPAGAAREELVALALYARERGWRMITRSSTNAFAVRATLPAAPAGRAVVAAPRRRRRRVLLLHGAGEERELLATLLREHDCLVSEGPPEPATAGQAADYDLVLIEQRLAHEEPGLAARLGARFARARVELVQPRQRPGSLLALLES